MKLYCFPQRSQCCLALAEEIAQVSTAALQQNKFFSIVLSGGSTPQYLYKLLAEEEWQMRIPWQKAHIFFGDERCVPGDNQDSNHRMAEEALLKRVPVPAEQVHRIIGESNNPVDEAQRYERQIMHILQTISPSQPSFDMTLLGLGGDGHTASLFPDEDITNYPGVVTAVSAPKLMTPSVPRISLTINGIGMSRNICFLIHGDEKQKIVADIMHDESLSYPASLIKQFNPSWYLSGMNCEGFDK